MRQLFLVNYPLKNVMQEMCINSIKRRTKHHHCDSALHINLTTNTQNDQNYAGRRLRESGGWLLAVLWPFHWVSLRVINTSVLHSWVQLMSATTGVFDDTKRGSKNLWASSEREFLWPRTIGFALYDWISEKFSLQYTVWHHQVVHVVGV